MKLDPAPPPLTREYKVSLTFNALRHLTLGAPKVGRLRAVPVGRPSLLSYPPPLRPLHCLHNTPTSWSTQRSVAWCPSLSHPGHQSPLSLRHAARVRRLSACHSVPYPRAEVDSFGRGLHAAHLDPDGMRTPHPRHVRQPMHYLPSVRPTTPHLHPNHPARRKGAISRVQTSSLPEGFTLQ